MISKDDRIDSFLKNMETGEISYSEKNLELSKLAMEGIDPCKLCGVKKDTCTMMCCLPWYKYFRYRWRRLQKGMLQKGRKAF